MRRSPATPAGSRATVCSSWASTTPAPGRSSVPSRPWGRTSLAWSPWARPTTPTCAWSWRSPWTPSTPRRGCSRRPGWSSPTRTRARRTWSGPRPRARRGRRGRRGRRSRRPSGRAAPGGCGCGCPGATTSSTPPSRSPRPSWAWVWTPPGCWRASPASRGPDDASRPSARPPGSGWWTTTRTTRQRWPPRSPPPAPWPVGAGCTCCSSRTCTPGPGSSPKVSGRPCRRPRRSSSWTSTAPARTPNPASAGRRWPTSSPAAGSSRTGTGPWRCWCTPHGRGTWS